MTKGMSGMYLMGLSMGFWPHVEHLDDYLFIFLFSRIYPLGQYQQSVCQCTTPFATPRLGRLRSPLFQVSLRESYMFNYRAGLLNV
jgi:hypothetical protein